MVSPSRLNLLQAQLSLYRSSLKPQYLEEYQQPVAEVLLWLAASYLLLQQARLNHRRWQPVELASHVETSEVLFVEEAVLPTSKLLTSRLVAD